MSWVTKLKGGLAKAKKASQELREKERARQAAWAVAEKERREREHQRLVAKQEAEKAALDLEAKHLNDLAERREALNRAKRNVELAKERKARSEGKVTEARKPPKRKATVKRRATTPITRRRSPRITPRRGRLGK